jgi:hypothetical protein
MLLPLILGGPGRLSLDAWIARRLRHPDARQPAARAAVTGA